MAKWSSLSSLLILPLQVTSPASLKSLILQLELWGPHREIASHIHDNFGSTDNIAALKDSLDETQGDEGVGPGGMRMFGTGQLQSSPKYGSDDDCSSDSSGSAANSTTGSPGALSCSRGNTRDHTQASGVDALLHEVQALKDNQGQLEDSFENLEVYYQQNYTVIMEALQKAQYRCDFVEQQLSDLTELHQNEIVNMYEELIHMEEKITHQFYEETDIDEALQACQTRLFKLEQQQVVQLESLENATTQTLLGKVINVGLAVMAVLLLMVSTVANMLTYSCMFSILFFVVFFSFLWRHWDATSEYLHTFFCTQHR